MRQLTPAGRQAIENLVQRHGFSTDAVQSMLDSVINGNGGMAQFNHPEFGGSGQWMRGGMIMLSDMFNNYLKGRVDALCNDLAQLVASQPDLIQTGSFQSQSQNGGYQAQGNNGWSSQGYDAHQQQTSAGSIGTGSLFIPPAAGSGNWWGSDLVHPNSTGSQNNARYAYFAQARRLAIEVNGTVTIYDTLDHQIGGFSQQQSHGGSLGFSSQYGLISVSSLPVISINGVRQNAPEPVRYSAPPAEETSFAPQSSANETDIFAKIERLADLKAKGILNDSEFSSKKSELLSRL